MFTSLQGRSTIYLEKKTTQSTSATEVFSEVSALDTMVDFLGWNGWVKRSEQAKAFDIDAFGGTKQTWILI